MEMITIDDFKKLDIRIGKIISAEKIVDSNKLLKLIVDFGEEKRQIISGIAMVVDNPVELIDKEVPVLMNLLPRNIMGYESQGMILAVDNDGVPVLINPAKNVLLGSKIS